MQLSSHYLVYPGFDHVSLNQRWGVFQGFVYVLHRSLAVTQMIKMLGKKVINPQDCRGRFKIATWNTSPVIIYKIFDTNEFKYFRTKQRNSDLCLSKSQRCLYCPDNQGLCFPQSLPEKKEGAKKICILLLN